MKKYIVVFVVLGLVQTQLPVLLRTPGSHPGDGGDGLLHIVLLRYRMDPIPGLCLFIRNCAGKSLCVAQKNEHVNVTVK